MKIQSHTARERQRRTYCSQLSAFSHYLSSLPFLTYLSSLLFLTYLSSLLFLTYTDTVPCAFLCCCSVAQSRPILCGPMDCSTPGLPVLHHLPELLKLMSVESVMPSNHLILCRPFSSCLQSFPASGSFPMSWLFESGGQGIRASASVFPMNLHSGLISLRMDWLDLLAVHGTLKSLLQHHSSKASILLCSAFFMV